MNTEIESGSIDLFWAKRLATYGHTGWADPVIYAFDQYERLSTIRRALECTSVVAGSAIDFGCGTGDFSRLLLSMGYSVLGYDPFVNPDIPSPAFRYAASFREFDIPLQSADVAIAITVLDHVLDEDSVLRDLEEIRRRLKDYGIFLMMEYALDSESEARKIRGNGYQSFRTVSTWRRLLENSSFMIEGISPVPHPIDSPSLGFLAYKQSLITRISNKAKSLGVPNGPISKLRNFNSKRFVRKFSTLAFIQASPLKLFRVKPI